MVSQNLPKRTVIRANLLKQLLDRYGKRLLQDARLVRSLLADLSPSRITHWQRRVLILVVEEGIAEELWQQGTSKKIDSLSVQQQVRRLTKASGIRVDVALWGISCWAQALNIQVIWPKLSATIQESFLIPTWIVAFDGGGTHDSLTEALKDATPGAIIQLQRGIHRLERSLLLRHPVSLIGEGLEVTEIVTDQGDYILRYEGEGLFRLRDLTVRRVGANPQVTDVISVYKGEIEIENCHFAGATWSDKWIGAGLEVRGSVCGKIANCQIDRSGYGIFVADEAKVILENNICQQNNKNGIYVSGQAQATLEGNICQQNEQSGITYLDTSVGVARRNTCISNNWSGISIYGQAHPILEANISKNNEYHGIYIGEQAQPTLERNFFLQNKLSGIRYAGSSSGSARWNICASNESNGIDVTEQAWPTLEANVCQHNEFCGIYYGGRTNGISQWNVCLNNKWPGIYKEDQTHPTLENNICS